jgi:hypothetical protein
MAHGELLKECEDLQQRSRKDPDFLKRPVKIPSGYSLPWAAWHIVREAMCRSIRDNVNLSNPNHWQDFVHMVVPCAYCDFVLLDRAWATKAKQVITRSHNPNQPIRMARVFSSRELADFWSAFDVADIP